MNRISNLFLFFVIPAVAVLISCARAKIQDETVPLKKGQITKSSLILVKEITADRATFTGDKSAEETRVKEEKATVKSRLSSEIITQLHKRGFNARKFGDVKDANAFVLEGSVSHFDHGSAAGRMFVGMGAGSSNMHIPLKITRSGSTVAEFEVVATSGGRGGWTSMGSFMKAHIDDAGDKTAEYIEKNAN